MQDIRTGLGVWSMRYHSPKIAGQLAKAIEATGQVDQIVLWDELTGWWPQALWEPSVTPLARHIPDLDSFPDAFTTCAFALSAVEKIGFSICTDASRRDPPELAQMMLALATATEGKGTLYLGAGEVRHIAPFGRDRKMGIKRLEDALQILRLLLKERKLVNFDGRVWQLRDAWLGNGCKERRPEVVAMGGGPRLTEMAVKYADGFSSCAPSVFSNAEKYGETVCEIKKMRAANGLGDVPFHFGLQYIVFMCKSKDDFEQYVDNPMLRWWAATGGRFKMTDWAEEGIEPAFPLDWHYAFDMRPSPMSRAEVDAIVAKVTPEMVRKSFFYGSPEDIAAEIIPFVKQGSNLNLIADLSPLMMEIDPFDNIKKLAEVCRLVKAG